MSDAQLQDNESTYKGWSLDGLLKHFARPGATCDRHDESTVQRGERGGGGREERGGARRGEWTLNRRKFDIKSMQI